MTQIEQDDLLLIEAFPMPQLKRTRTLRIYLPYDYKTSDKRYPVLYMHDGQNVFDEITATYGMCWQAKTTLDEMQQQGETDGIILVAIDSSDELDKMGRYNEYSPWKATSQISEFGIPDEFCEFGGEGDNYVDFIVDTLKPYIDLNYRTQPQRSTTYLAGSSMGGLISLYGGGKHQHAFGALGVFSPAFWFNHGEYFNYASGLEFELPVKIYMDMGTNEKRDDTNVDFAKVYLDGSRSINELLLNKDNVSLIYMEAEGHEHNEIAWAKRFPDFIRFIVNH
ncbi:alpha/beta hydrolase-fold protein [Vibrio sp. Isolate30]|uniref:alpha/beta hydrolase n=1 Tax=Vibrio sp. Isolate30 TaxID=2908536 RepID=UPI001EFDC428|nr:alpha/beta hydrolase-fold protein [Vibrio sp. Isolate30]MCG9629648.1 alpha/beta hydrolase [Vibrio sp. Isolate30]